MFPLCSLLGGQRIKDKAIEDQRGSVTSWRSHSSYSRDLFPRELVTFWTQLTPLPKPGRLYLIPLTLCPGELNSLKAQIKRHLVQDQKETAQRGQKPPYFLPVSLGTCSIYPEATGRIILGVWNSPKDDYSYRGILLIPESASLHTDKTISGSRRGAGQELWGQFGEWGRAKRAVHTYNINQETLTENFHLWGIVPSSPYRLTYNLV